jgi:hypothetical protein
VLYGIADCELHVFVDLDRKKNLERLYWVQFEQYVPTRPELHHTYDSPERVTIGGLDFYVDSWVRASDETTEAGSDREHIDALIRAKGYVMPADMIYVRLVHLFDAEKRKELMIIYGENLASIGLKAEDLKPGGKARDQWPTLERSRVERAKTRIVIEETGKP